MSILQYYKRVSEPLMPNPNGPLSTRIPSSAIAAANKEVAEMAANVKTGQSSKRGSYHRYTPKQRAEIGKYASENGVQAARARYSRKLEIAIHESTVRKFRGLYTKELMKRRDENSSTSITEFNLQKRGRPLLLGDRLDLMVKRYVDDTRKAGGMISTAIVRVPEPGAFY